MEPSEPDPKPKPDDIANEIQKQSRKGPPPVDRWNPPLSGDIDIRIARNGQWFYRGSPMTREAMVQLFSTILRREPDGSFVLVTPVEKFRIRVDDAPFQGVELLRQAEGSEQRLTLITNVGDQVLIGPLHPLRVEIDPDTGEPAPYVLVRTGLEALLSRNLFYELVDIAEERDIAGSTCLGVWSAGQFFVIGAI